MTILYSETICESTPWVTFAFLMFAAILFGLYGFVIGASSSDDEAGAIAAKCFPLIIVAIVFTILGEIALTGDPFASKDVHYATIDDASLSEVLEDYDIVEQKGSLFILEEKEN